MTLEHVEVFEVPNHIVAVTERSIQAAGRDGYELFVLWSGVFDEEVFHVRRAHVPKQTTYKTEQGLLVRIEGPALHRLNVWLFEAKESLGAQVHAHPTDAYHSETDDLYPVVTTLGGLSIVAAEFAEHGLLNADTAAYRLSREGWTELEAPSELLKVIP